MKSQRPTFLTVKARRDSVVRGARRRWPHLAGCRRDFLELLTRKLVALLWADLCPRQIQTPGPQNVVVFGDRVFKEVVKVQ